MSGMNNTSMSETAEAALTERIRQAMAERPDGLLSFRDYMDLCLYCPRLGYYMNGRTKLGRDGDFYTSPFVGSVMGETVASWIGRFAEEAAWHGEVRLTEWGGGSGRLANQVLTELKTSAPDLYARLRYYSIETSPHHRELQAETLDGHRELVRFLTAEEWLQAGPWAQTIVFSNELPDAFPVHRLVWRPSGWHELWVRWDAADGSFAEAEQPVAHEGLLGYIAAERLPERPGQRFEANLDALAWMRILAEALAPGSAALTIDYGAEREELHAEHRMNGTLLGYRSHLATDEPLRHVGSQDLTAHVNFSALREAGEAAGLDRGRFMTQKAFLVENGLLDRLQSHGGADPFSPAARRNRSISQLLLGGGMSETFKVLIQQKR